MRIFSATLIIFCFVITATAQSPDQKPFHDSSPKDVSTVSQPQDLNQLADRYFDEYFFAYNPTAGTSAGFHQYDVKLENYSRASIERQIALLKKFKQEFAAQDMALSHGDSTAQADHALLMDDINSRLLEFENIRGWEKNADLYSSGIAGSAFTIMSRKFDTPDNRLKSLVARERQMPAVFDAARANLKGAPKVYTQVAIDQVPGIISFFQHDVPEAFKDAKDPDVRAEFDKSNAAVIASLESYLDWLKKDLLPRSNGDFRIGADNFRKKLLYNEMVDIDLDRLYDIGLADLRKNQQHFKEVAYKLDPSKTPAQILDQISKDHPAADDLLESFRATLNGLVTFIQQKHIVTIPSEVRPIVEETPPFARALTSASMDTPGPYEKVAKEAYFNVTLPDPKMSAQEQEEMLEGVNRGTIISTSIHEVYPGHYTQFLWLQVAPNLSKTRKLLGCASNAEGWAHYTEQMMLDEGYDSKDGSGKEVSSDPAFLKARLGQLQDALLRNARWIVGLQMHRGKMTFDQGVDFFVKEGYQPRAYAERETKRGTSDPTYLYYTLGKLEILKLRADYAKKVGEKNFSLQKFHDDILKQGFPPIKIIRRNMLGNDSPTL
ncbi:MAG: DUF885 domain-containing protein [Acidobacteriaceae bacterium]